MALHLIGINHRTAPLAVRETLSFDATTAQEALARWKTHHGLDELVLLSTCNRTELYFRGDDRASSSVRQEWLARLPKTSGVLYEKRDGDVIAHLFRVSCGLDSLVVGEQEILGQVKQAYLLAQQSGFTQKLLNVLFQRSLFVGKRIRTETGLAYGSGSVASVAVTLAERIFGSLEGRSVLIVGAGKMAELTARYLRSVKVANVVVANRTLAHAQSLARKLDGRGVDLAEGLRYLTEADVVICSTAATSPIFQRADVEETLNERKGRSLFFIDIAVPRDVHPDVHQLDNVYVYTLDDLEQIVRDNQAQRADETQRAERMAQEEYAAFVSWYAAYQQGAEHALSHYRPTTPSASL